MKTITAFLASALICTTAFAVNPRPQPRMSTPVLSCGSHTPSSITVHICAGATGAPAGFSIQWMTAAALAANGGVWPTDETQFCKASFSGVPGCSAYNLPAGQCTDVQIGDNLFDNCGASSGPCPFSTLDCNTEYVFRAFAHANSTYQRSNFTSILHCTTGACDGGGGNDNCCVGGCTFTQGYWKTHGPVGCQNGNNTNQWPADVLTNGLTLGGCTYTADQLCSILNDTPQGNGWLNLAHQLIAAELNIANGACAPPSVTDAIAEANAWLGTTSCYPAGTLAPADTSDLTNTLTDFNEGTIGPGHCE